MIRLFRILALAASVLLIVPSCLNKSTKLEHPITVHIRYDEPINGYQVNGEFFPFDAQGETGQVTMRFTSLTGGQDFVYSNVDKFEDGHPEYPAKFTGYNICEYILTDENACFHDGDTLEFHYNTEPSIFKDSPLYYYAEFQFFDVDFDGKEEFLVSDYYRGKGGNNYGIYEITPRGLKKKSYKPFDRISNTTVFDADRKVITDVLNDGVSHFEYIESKIAPDGNSAKRETKAVPRTRPKK